MDKVLYITKAKEKQIFVVKFDIQDKDDTIFLSPEEYNFLLHYLSGQNNTTQQRV